MITVAPKVNAKEYDILGNLPNVLAGSISSFLSVNDHEALRLLNKNGKRIIEEIIPLLPNLWKDYDTLNPLHRTPNYLSRRYEVVRLKKQYELAFIKFMGRPLYQRIGLVVLTIVLSPAILVYNSPKLGRRGFKHILKPLVSGSITLFRKVVEKICHFVKQFFIILYSSLVKPVVKFSATVIRFGYNKILAPTGSAIRNLAKFIADFGKRLCSYLNQKIVTPTTTFIRQVADYTNEKIIAPLTQIIKTVVHAVLIDLPRDIYYYVLKPAAEGLQFIGREIIKPSLIAVREGVKYTYYRGIKPLALLISNIVKSVFKHVVEPIARKIWQGIKLINEYVLTPIMRLVKAIAKGIFITIPKKIIEHAIVPLLKGIGKGVLFTYNKILTPLMKLVKIFAKGFFYTIPKKVWMNVVKPLLNYAWSAIRLAYNTIVAPVLQLVCKIATEIFITLPKMVYNHVLTPIGHGISFCASLLNEYIFKPSAQAIALVAKMVFIELPLVVKDMVLEPGLKVCIEIKNIAVVIITTVVERIFGS
jgi:hypothetical protein